VLHKIEACVQLLLNELVITCFEVEVCKSNVDFDKHNMRGKWFGCDRGQHSSARRQLGSLRDGTRPKLFLNGGRTVAKKAAKKAAPKKAAKKTAKKKK
jgi:hypothetical protein